MARADNDTWDLASSVGATATGVAVGRAPASRAPKPLINDAFALPLVQAVSAGTLSRAIAGKHVAALSHYQIKHRHTRPSLDNDGSAAR